jgi:hypothetical protein
MIKAKNIAYRAGRGLPVNHHSVIHGPIPSLRLRAFA